MNTFNDHFYDVLVFADVKQDNVIKKYVINEKYCRKLSNIFEEKRFVDYYNFALVNELPYALCSFGIMYSVGYGVEKDFSKAIELFNINIKNGHVISMHFLGKIYEHKQDYKKAIELYELASIKGDSFSQNRLAIRYEKGEIVERNYDKAFELYKMSATNGNKYAIYNLALIHATKPYGQYDLVKAMKFFNICVDMNCIEGTNMLAELYENGTICKQSHLVAYDLYHLAQNNDKIKNMHDKHIPIEELQRSRSIVINCILWDILNDDICAIISTYVNALYLHK